MPNRCSAPLTEVDLSATIGISLIEYLIGSLIDGSLVLARVDLAVDANELFSLDHSVTILVKLVKRRCQLFQLLFRSQMGRHESESGLLQLRVIL